MRLSMAMGAACTVVVFAGAAFANPTVVFSDNFDTENGGQAQLNYTGFANWTVSEGTVDLIGVGSQWDYLPGNGLYVDLDGSSGDAGVLAQSSAITFESGKLYTLTFDLAGNQRGGSESVDIEIGVGVLLSHTLSVASSDPFLLRTYTFLGDGSTGTISFANAGGDNVGAILDNVTLTASIVPLPSVEGLAGLGLLGLATRRDRGILA